ncbi:MAG TPA: hypothetical protein VFT51_10295 [Bacillales bacterium]|nr:hypothetical protein [Bacillales bacterium]
MEHVKDISIARQLYSEIAEKGIPEKLQLFFDADVLTRYSDKDDVKIIRTDTSGRVSKRGVWSLDFGISGEKDEIIHIAGEGFIHRLPEAERDHWIEHMITLPVSQNFIKGLVRPGCLDDGPIREW